MAQDGTQATTEHDRIRRWAEEHGAQPATVRGTGTDEPGVLTLDVVGHGADERQLEHISWEDWLAKFEESQLAFLYQDAKKSGEESTFFKLVERS